LNGYRSEAIQGTLSHTKHTENTGAFYL